MKQAVSEGVRSATRRAQKTQGLTQKEQSDITDDDREWKMKK
jgi:hypothetical protein